MGWFKFNWLRRKIRLPLRSMRATSIGGKQAGFKDYFLTERPFKYPLGREAGSPFYNGLQNFHMELGTHLKKIVTLTEH